LKRMESEYKSINEPVDCSCGTVPKTASYSGYIWVRCPGCGWMGPTTNEDEEERDAELSIDAVSLWNAEIGRRKP